jgi:hypothetical protein
MVSREKIGFPESGILNLHPDILWRFSRLVRGFGNPLTRCLILDLQIADTLVCKALEDEQRLDGTQSYYVIRLLLKQPLTSAPEWSNFNPTSPLYVRCFAVSSLTELRLLRSLTAIEAQGRQCVIVVIHQTKKQATYGTVVAYLQITVQCSPSS